MLFNGLIKPILDGIVVLFGVTVLLKICEGCYKYKNDVQD